MQLEVGSILEGKITGITNFGAFVDLPGGVTGMVHISEVAPTYVSQIRDHLKIGQDVKVKVLSVGEDGKISLSIKKAMEPQQQSQRPGGRGGRPTRRGTEEGSRLRRRLLLRAPAILNGMRSAATRTALRI